MEVDAAMIAIVMTLVTMIAMRRKAKSSNVNDI